MSNDAALAGGPGTTSVNAAPIVSDEGIARTWANTTNAQFSTAVMPLNDQIRVSDNTGSITFTFKNCTSGDTAPSYGGCPAANELHVAVGTYNGSSNTWTATQAATEFRTKLNASSVNVTASNSHPSYPSTVYMWNGNSLEPLVFQEDPNGTNGLSGHSGVAAGTIFGHTYSGG